MKTKKNALKRKYLIILPKLSLASKIIGNLTKNGHMNLKTNTWQKKQAQAKVIIPRQI